MVTNSGNNGSSGGTGMNTGTVKWFNDAKGYGFITPDSGEEELFAHFSAIEMAGFKTLKEGQKVRFKKARGDKGWQATNVQAVDGDYGQSEHHSYQDDNKAALGEAHT